MTAEGVTPEGGASDPTHAVRATFKGLSAVIPATSAVTALLYYYGWTRSSVEARRLGLEDSLLGYSTQDYLLRSMSSMLAPLGFCPRPPLVGSCPSIRPPLGFALVFVLLPLPSHPRVRPRAGRDAGPA